jgi:Spy/CpxP family protein refolding chaperone
MRLAAVTFLAALSCASLALAAAPAAKKPATPAPAAQAQKPLTPEEACAKQAEARGQRFDQLAKLLKLTDAQKPVFETWRKTRLDAANALPCPPMKTGMNVPTPERMKNQITQMSAMLEGLKKIQQPTEDLYKALTPDQRKIFDAPMRMMMQVEIPPGGPKNGKLSLKPAGADAPTPPPPAQK